jgi:hypothetical protein
MHAITTLSTTHTRMVGAETLQPYVHAGQLLGALHIHDKEGSIISQL